MWSTFARAIPSTTVLTASKCEGFGASVKPTFFPFASVTCEVNPWWYFTSPSKYSIESNSFPSNSEKISFGRFSKIFVNVFKRPRCAIPTTKYSTPSSDPFFTNVSIAGINASPPSIEKRFCPTNFLPKKASKLAAWFSFLKIASLCAASKVVRFFISILFLNQSMRSGSRM